jgi:dGTPase
MHALWATSESVSFVANNQASRRNLADEIAYNNHDVDDGIRAGIIDFRDLSDVRLFRREYDAVTDLYPDLGERRLVYEIVRRMINFVVTDLIKTTQSRLDEAQPRSIEDVRRRTKPLVGLSDAARAEHDELKAFLRERVYRHYKVLRMTTKARRVLKELFDAFFEDVHLMPNEHLDAALRGEKDHGIAGRARAVADYVAGMTDRYAILEHRRLFDPSERT